MARITETITICDRCNERFEGDPLLHQVSVNSRLTNNKIGYGVTAGRSIDIGPIEVCSGCLSEIEELWNEYIAAPKEDNDEW